MNEKSGKVLVVTGGAGFVGTHLIDKLLSQYPDAEIISLDNYFTGTTSNHIENERVTYLVGNTQDIHDIWQRRGLPKPDAVFHLGEYSRIVQSFDDFEVVWDSNLRGTKEVVTFCHKHKCKLIYAGSSSKFGNEGSDEHLSPYAWIKAKNVEFINDFADWFGLDYVVTYFYNVYGPRHIRTGKYATVIGIFESSYEKGESLPVVSPGTQTRDFTHVDDIVAGIILCFEKAHGDGYQLGSGNEYSIIQVAEMFSDTHEFIPSRKGERVHGKADLTKIRALGWEPVRSLPDYVEEFKKEVSARAGAR
jgi:UDP-glucose 4-epimerase